MRDVKDVPATRNDTCIPNSGKSAPCILLALVMPVHANARRMQKVLPAINAPPMGGPLQPASVIGLRNDNIRWARLPG